MTVHEAHTRVLVEGPRPDVRVPVTQVALTNGETFDRYSTEGPGCEPEIGLPRLREAWVRDRADTTTYDGRATELIDNGRAAVRRGRPRAEWPGMRPGRGGPSTARGSPRCTTPVRAW